jgi:hypothetical protein
MLFPIFAAKVNQRTFRALPERSQILFGTRESQETLPGLQSERPDYGAASLGRVNGMLVTAARRQSLFVQTAFMMPLFECSEIATGRGRSRARGYLGMEELRGNVWGLKSAK